MPSGSSLFGADMIHTMPMAILSSALDETFSVVTIPMIKMEIRNMNRFIERNIEDKISELLIEKDNTVTGISLSVKKDSLSIDVI